MAKKVFKTLWYWLKNRSIYIYIYIYKSSNELYYSKVQLRKLSGNTCSLLHKWEWKVLQYAYYAIKGGPSVPTQSWVWTFVDTNGLVKLYELYELYWKGIWDFMILTKNRSLYIIYACESNKELFYSIVPWRRFKSKRCEWKHMLSFTVMREKGATACLLCNKR
jgi:hypothetical protein